VCFIYYFSDCYNHMMYEVAAMARKYPRRIIAVIAVSLLLCVLFAGLQAHPHELLISFLDVGQGDAVLITAPNGNRLLYDAGPPTNAVLLALDRELSYFDRRIAFMVASHPDADHIGAFGAVLAHYTPYLYLDGHTRTGSEDFVVLENSLIAKHIERRTLTRGSKLLLGGGVDIDVLNPVQDARTMRLSTNDASLVLRVSYGSSTILLTGDLESGEESRLVDVYGGALKATILKAGHHGSKSSSSERFLSAVRPEFIAISVGKNNRYGHPSAAAIDRMNRTGARILQTALLGSIHFSCTQVTCNYRP
jgi:beta-lactamase superfamily II metal-dependent hydrolase